PGSVTRGSNGRGSPQRTPAIPYNAPATTVQDALVKLSNIGAGNVTVTEEATAGGNVYTITFVSGLTHTDVDGLHAEGSLNVTVDVATGVRKVTSDSGGSFTLTVS